MNSAVGIAVLAVRDAALASMLGTVQNELFDLGADLATPGEDFAPTETQLRIVQAQVDRIEADIDRLNAGLKPLTSFILPAGTGGGAELHVARAIARRAERSVVAAARAVPINPLARAYLNRLSDLLFVAARYAASADGEVLWKPGATRSG